MLVSMTPNDEVKTIHASLNDGSLRKWEFEPYTEQGKIELTDQDYATIQSIKGNTVKFNQLVQNGNFADDSVWGSANGTFSVSGNKLIATASTSALQIIQSSTNAYKSEEKFYIACGVKASVSTNVRFRISRHSPVGLHNYAEFSVSANVHTRVKAIITLANDLENTRFSFFVPDSASGDTFELDNFICINLTSIFGSGNEPSTPEAFETWLSNNIGLLLYYAYNPGTLISFNGTGLKSTGKNLLSSQLDYLKEINDLGTWNDNVYTFRNTTTTINLNENGYIESIVVNGTPDGGNYTFYLQRNIYSETYNHQPLILTGCPQGGGSSTYRIRFQMRPSPNTSIGDDVGNGVNINIPDDGLDYQILLRVQANYTVNNLTFYPMLRLASVSDDTYEPYVSNTLHLPVYDYFPTGMKNVHKSGGETTYDELSSSKADTRIGSITFDGSESGWSKSSLTSCDIYIITRSNFNFDLGFECDSFIPYYDGQKNTVGYVWRGSSSAQIRIGFAEYGTTTLDDFKAWLAEHPVTLYCALATPTSQDISIDLTYPIWNGGTEQILPVNGSTPTTSSMKATIEYPDRTEDVDFLYKQTTFESAIPQFSLVCKNQELPMTLNDGKLICECDSSITNESGFFDCKVKMQDLDSIAYSQKIQLHVERGIND